jgi:hypothetical protein
MAKRIVLYNLAPHVTPEDFKAYVTREKGPLISCLPSVRKYELIKISGSAGTNIPYQYVGILDVTGLDEFDNLAANTQKYQDFLKKFGPMVKDLIMLSGDNIY